MSQRRSNSRGRNSRNTTAKRDRYSVEQSGVSFALTPFQVTNGAVVATDGDDIGLSFPVVPYTGTQGLRKVKHLTVTCTLASGLPSNVASPVLPNLPIIWALVYYPQPSSSNLAQSFAPIPYKGGQTQALFASLYEPNQHVISCGIAQMGSPLRISTPLARNLNSNDQIYLTMRISGAAAYANALGQAPGAEWLAGTHLNAVIRYAVTYN